MLIYRSRVFDLYSNSISSRQAPLEYVGHKGSCGALLLDSKQNIGLLAHHRPAIGKTLFELPAGTIDLQRPVEEIMVKELKEEANLTIPVTQLQRLTGLYPSPGYTSEMINLYLVHITTEQKKACENLRWFSFEELQELIRKEEIVDMKTVAAIATYGLKLWSKAA